MVLSGYAGDWKPALLVNLAGEEEELACFERDYNTDLYYSCSVNWRNQLLVFGGNYERRQISRLTGHKLERVGDLPFTHYAGACSVMADRLIFLCFSYERKLCRRSTGPLEKFSEVIPSNHDHERIQTSCSDSKLLLSVI